MQKRSFIQMLSCILALLLVVSMVPAMSASAAVADVAEGSGTTDNGLNYEIIDGEVTITRCKGLRGEIVVPSRIEGYPVTRIGDNAFAYNILLESVILPKGITSIGEYAFSDSGLKSITIPEGVTSINQATFFLCSFLTDITIPQSVKSIGEKAFSHCQNLKSITIPKGVTSIGYHAFEQCPNLEFITISEDVASIDEGAFYWCLHLTDVYYCGTEEQWEEIYIGEDNSFLLNSEIHFNYIIPTEPQVIYLLGDANLDGEVNIKDATEIQKAVAALLTLDETAELVADVDGSGDVNIKDATAIQRWIANIETGLDIGKETTV